MIYTLALPGWLSKAILYFPPIIWTVIPSLGRWVALLASKQSPYRHGARAHFNGIAQHNHLQHPRLYLLPDIAFTFSGAPPLVAVNWLLEHGIDLARKHPFWV